MELVHRRDQQTAHLAAQQEQEKRQLKEAYEARQRVRASLRANASAPVAALLDDLQQLDQSGDELVAKKIVETAKLAPEVFNPSMVEHLFSLVEAGELWATQTALTCLQVAATDVKRLVACAIQCLAREEAIDIAADIVCRNVNAVDASQVTGAVKSLCFLAAPPKEFPHHSKPEQHPEALQALAAEYPLPVEQALDKLLASASADTVKATARALPLVYFRKATPISLVRSLAAKLARVDTLIDSDRDMEVDEVAHELGRALGHALLIEHQQVDVLLMNYYQGASSTGEARLAGVYSHILRLPGNRFESPPPIVDSKPYGTALRRVLTLATSTKNPEVIDEIHEAFRYFPDQLADIALDEMEFLLGTAALVDQAYTAFLESPPPPETPENFLAHLERDNHLRRLYGLRSAILDWTSRAAGQSSAASAKFTTFVLSNAAWPERFRSALVEALPPMLVTTASINAVLPFLYGAMVGESAIVRMSAARAIGEISTSRVRDLPSLVYEAFLLQLADPKVAVHQAATNALTRISLPEEYDVRIYNQLVHLFIAYSQERLDDDFMVTCADLLVSRRRSTGEPADALLRLIVGVLMKVDAMTLLRSGRTWLLKRLAAVDGYPELVLKLLSAPERGEHHDDELIALLRSLTRDGLLHIRDGVFSLSKSRPDDWVLAGALVEVFGAAAIWDASAEVATAFHQNIPESTWMRARRRLTQGIALAVQFERLLAEGRQAEAFTYAVQWREVRNQLDPDRENS